MAVPFFLGLAVSMHSHAQIVPVDPKVTCSVSQTEFNAWFKTGAPAVDGIVKPADSVAFPNQPNCSFYKWSEQDVSLSPSPGAGR